MLSFKKRLEHDQLLQLLRDAKGFKRAGNLSGAKQVVEAALRLKPSSEEALGLLRRIRLMERIKV